MIVRKILSFLFLLVLVSCYKGTIYDKVYNDFPGNHWLAGDIKTFDFTLDEKVDAGKIELLFSHVSESQFPVVPLQVIMVYPSGKAETIPVNLLFKDGDGKSLSNCVGDVCDLTQTIKDVNGLEKGNYKITVQNKFDNPYLPNVLALGLTIREAKE